MNDSRPMDSGDTSAFPPFSAEQAGALLEHIRALSVRHVLHRMPQVWAEWCDGLARQASRPTHNAGESSQYLASRAALMAARASLERRLCQHLDEGFSERLSARRKVPSNRPEINFPEISIPEINISEVNSPEAQLTNRQPTYIDWRSIIGAADQTESLAQAASLQRVERQVAESLWAVQHRLALLGGGRVVDENSPLSPAHFCEAFSQSLQALALPSFVRLVGHHVFARRVLDGLGELYDEINRYCIAQGVLPNLGFSTSTGLMRSPSERKAPPSHAAHWEDRYQHGLYHAIRLLRHHTVTRAQVPDEESREQEAIDLVEAVFEYLWRDESLPETAKAALASLQAPLVQLALHDETFFQQPEHPARRLINEWAAAAERWMEEASATPNDVHQCLRDTIQSLLVVPEPDRYYFAARLTDFQSEIGVLTRHQERVEQRALEKIKGQERWRDVRDQVNREVQRRMEPGALPSAVLLLLAQPWADYMAFVLMRHGPVSAEWSQCLGSMDELLWTLQPKTSETERQRQDSLQAPLLEALQTGFDAIGYGSDKGHKLLEAVRCLQAIARQGRQAEPAPEPMRAKLAAFAAESADSDAAGPGATTEEEQQWLDQLRRVEPGTWLEEAGGGRKKIVWYNRRTLHFMLVDRQSGKILMRGGVLLARDLIAKRLRLIEGSARPFFGRALEHIYRQLNHAARGSSTDRGSFTARGSFKGSTDNG